MLFVAIENGQQIVNLIKLWIQIVGKCHKLHHHSTVVFVGGTLRQFLATEFKKKKKKS